MRMVLSFVFVVALLVLAQPWAARAGDGKSVEERLANVEQRLVAVEEHVTTVRDLLFEARLSASEMAAIASLRNLMSAQAQFQAAAVIDEDQDGLGEYGGFAELTGGAAGRMARPLNPPILGAGFRTLNANGEANRSGYCFRIYLAARGGAPLGEPQTGFVKGGGQEVDLGEIVWCCYAWPVKHGTSGKRTFFVNQEGDVLTTESAAYSGTGSGPRPEAAFKSYKPATITGALAAGIVGADGNTWQGVN